MGEEAVDLIVAYRLLAAITSLPWPHSVSIGFNSDDRPET